MIGMVLCPLYKYVIFCGDHVQAQSVCAIRMNHDDVINWKYFPDYFPSVRGIHRSPVDSPHKVQWRGCLMFSLVCVWTNNWANSPDAGELIRNDAHLDVTVKCVGSALEEWCSTNQTQHDRVSLLCRILEICIAPKGNKWTILYINTPEKIKCNF